MDAFSNYARLEQVDGVLLGVGGGAAGEGGQLVVDDDTQTSEERHFGLAYANAAAAPGDGTAC